jgi:thiol-disulfide isomerase/thioredoxin
MKFNRILIPAMAVFLAALPMPGKGSQKWGSNPFAILRLNHEEDFVPDDLVITSGVTKTSNTRNFLGRKLILHFWGIPCPSCRGELDDLFALAETAKAERIVFLPIFAGPPDEELRATSLLSQVPGKLPFWIAAPGSSRDLFLDYGLPVTYFVLPTEQITARAEGFRNWASYRDLRELLKIIFFEKH